MAIFRETVNCDDSGCAGSEAIFSVVDRRFSLRCLSEGRHGREDGPEVSKGGTDAERTVETS